MPAEHQTCWTMIREAAQGVPPAKEALIRLYQPVIRAYLVARWRRGRLVQAVDDASQDVFVELFRDRGVLDKADPTHGGGFRAFLLGVIRNVARRHEQRAEREGFRPLEPLTPSHDTSVASAFDRAWARSLLKEAARRQELQAGAQGQEALQRVELLRLRFQEGLAIRQIAERWQVPSEQVHRQYARARQEFRECLRSVVAAQKPGSSDAEITHSCQEILSLIS